MIKNITIAALGGALITRECPWFNTAPWGQQAAIWLGISACLLFFCLFWQGVYDRRLERRARIEEISAIVRRLCGTGGQGDA
ncbi:MAG: hypothetical protein NC092_04535 [Butyrivibrio sp.]|nr:hypothetical protein [Muribaculum sp.]MCM1551941.1 hypothetical protein [Butyrivibrio sp.]